MNDGGSSFIRDLIIITSYQDRACAKIRFPVALVRGNPLSNDPSFDRALAEAERLLTPLAKPERPLRMLAAAMFMTICALVFAATAILAPTTFQVPSELDQPVR